VGGLGVGESRTHRADVLVQVSLSARIGRDQVERGLPDLPG
jgi:hypothetical protein